MRELSLLLVIPTPHFTFNYNTVFLSLLIPPLPTPSTHAHCNEAPGSVTCLYDFVALFRRGEM